MIRLVNLAALSSLGIWPKTNIADTLTNLLNSLSRRMFKTVLAVDLKAPLRYDQIKAICQLGDLLELQFLRISTAVATVQLRTGSLFFIDSPPPADERGS